MVELLEVDTGTHLVISRKEYEQLKADHARFQADMAKLKYELEQLKRMIFGSKSERFVPAEMPGQPSQATLFGVEATAPPPPRK